MSSKFSKAALVACVIAAAACSKTDDGRVVVKSPGEIDVKTRTDTITPPRVTTEKETLIVNKPVIKKP